MHLPLPKIMVDPEDRRLVKDAEQESIQLLRRGEIVAERFFDNYPGARRAARFDELFHNSAEQYRRNRQVMRGMFGVLEFFAQRLKRRRVLVIAGHVPEQAGQFGERCGIESAMLLQTVLRSCLQLVETPIGLGHADNRHVKIATLQHRLQRREDLLVRQVARGAEEYEGIAMIRSHKSSLSHLLFQMTAKSESHC